jgi:hypothetical protein
MLLWSAPRISPGDKPAAANSSCLLPPWARGPVVVFARVADRQCTTGGRRSKDKSRIVEAITEGPFERFHARGSFAFLSSKS